MTTSTKTARRTRTTRKNGKNGSSRRSDAVVFSTLSKKGKNAVFTKSDIRKAFNIEANKIGLDSRPWIKKVSRNQYKLNKAAFEKSA